MKSSEEIKELAVLRLLEAQTLCENHLYDGAFYLAGYSIELMLKAKICEHLGVDNLFDEDCDVAGVSEIRKAVKTHDIRLLFIFSGLRTKLQTDIAEGNEELMEFYAYLIKRTGKKESCLWSEQVRYLPIGSQDPKEVIRLLELLKGETGLLKWIEQR